MHPDKKMKKISTFCLSLILALLCVLIFSTKAHAATFTVTDNGDASAVDPSVSCDTAGSVCTLRSAIEAANAQAGADSISFNIPGSGVHTITPGSALPSIVDEVTIDGSTQTGAQCGTLVPANLPATNTPHVLNVVINGNALGAANTLLFDTGSDNSVVKGLVLNGNTGNTALQINSTVGGVLIECNYLGTNAAGDTIVTNSNLNIGAFINSGTTTIQNNLISGSSVGVLANSANITNNLIGTNANGTGALGNSAQGILINYSSQNLAISHNIISGNNLGIYITLNGPNNSIHGNYIGVGVTGNPLGNTTGGITAFGANDFSIGGVSVTDRNIISANGGDGIHIYSNCNTGQSVGSTTYGNYIGTNTSGNVQNGFGNNGAGIEVNEYQGSCESVYNHVIGGDLAGQPNTIAGNTNQGVLVHQDLDHDVFSVVILGNSIYGNGQFGIDLASDSSGFDGVADTDLGPNPLNQLAMTYPTTVANYYLNTATINSATYTGNEITVNYSFLANPVQNSNDGVSLLTSDLVGYRLDFYINNGGQDGAYAGYGQGKIHLGSFIVSGAASGATHTFTSPIPLTNGQNITVTSTALWTNNPGPAITPRSCDGETQRVGNGPKYDYQGSCPN